MVRHVIDEIRLTRFQGRDSRRVFCDFFEDDFFDIRLAAPIVVVAGKNQIAAPLIADKFIWAGANQILIDFVAELFARFFTQHKAIVQAI